ncbi:hypothetical protein RB620_21490 [Paenibacillus sp. LHD-117]|uniref:transglutaminase domain-containing protein n=1 Tax=Paenibacillus sp. LHD-117 TaxID=3071412 RepID=UPI0027E07B67|nr:transglutaminase domain-containing protein [Paenibacillus sp. LHD-117]MDQ6422007.1 hypothetical protein [Paenibacillus sp. LHD-117]
MNYLSSSTIIDYDHPAINELFHELNTDSTDATFLKNVYRFARDVIEFEFCDFGDTIGDTVMKKKGHCYHKTNLITGLCRKKGIQAGIKLCTIQSDVLKPYLTDEVLDIFSGQPVSHFFSVILIEGKWVSVDSIFDKDLLRYSDRLHWAMAQEWSGFSSIELPRDLILNEHNEIFVKAFEDGDLPPANPLLDQMNEKLRVIRNELNRK